MQIYLHQNSKLYHIMTQRKNIKVVSRSREIFSWPSYNQLLMNKVWLIKTIVIIIFSNSQIYNTILCSSIIYLHCNIEYLRSDSCYFDSSDLSFAILSIEIMKKHTAWIYHITYLTMFLMTRIDQRNAISRFAYHCIWSQFYQRPQVLLSLFAIWKL